jgi:hypothetical protein
MRLPLIAAVAGGSFYAISQGASVGEAVLVIVCGGLILGVVGWLARQPTPTAFARKQLPTFRKWLGHPPTPVPALPPPSPGALAATEVGWGVRVVNRDVYLAITNRGDTQDFWASVEAIEGTADPYPSPFTVRWQEQDGERRTIARTATQLLYLARVEPEGDIEKYPIEYGAAAKASVERLRHWKPVCCRFQGLSREYVVFLDLSDLQPLERGLSDERYKRRLRVTVRLRSSDEGVKETRTVVLGIREVGDSRLSWGAGDAVVAEVEQSCRGTH